MTAFSVVSVQTHSAIVVGLVKFSSVTANKLKETMPSNRKILRYNTRSNWFAKIERHIY